MKSDAREHFREILYRYKIGEKITGADSDDLHALLKKHTDYSRKTLGGVAYFSVMVANFNSRCFEIVRPDGSSEDFSAGHCITPKK